MIEALTKFIAPIHAFLGPYSPTVLKKILCLILQDCVNLNVTQLLIGQTVWFGQSEVVLHSNAAKYSKIWRTRQRMLLRMVGEYGPWSSFKQYSTQYPVQATDWFPT